MGIPYLDILILAVIATVIILRLRSVLGRRTGNDGSPGFSHRDSQNGEAANGDSNVIPLPGQRGAGASFGNESFDEAVARIAPENAQLAHGLTAIHDKDRNFQPESFLAGARAAYEMIVTAFAAGNKKELSNLLSPDVADSFNAVITAREAEQKTVETDFIGIEKSEFVGAGLKNRISEITVKFVSEIISVTKNADGAVIEGDPTRVAKITDIWTFARDTSASDPNWKLIGTAVGH